MNVYVESNFVLQLALLQESHASCEAILRLCEGGDARLVIPAFSLVEPYRRLDYRHAQRAKVSAVAGGKYRRGKQSMAQLTQLELDERHQRKLARSLSPLMASEHRFRARPAGSRERG